MPRLPLHQLDPRIKSAVTDVESAKGTFTSVTQRVDTIHSEIIDARGADYATLKQRLDSIGGSGGGTPSGFMRSQTITAIGAETAIPLPPTFDPLASVLIVYRNGQLLHETEDYTLSVAAMTVNVPMSATEIIDFYWFETPMMSLYLRVTPDGTAVKFIIGPEMIDNNSQLLVTVNGLLQTPDVDYTTGSNSITFTYVPFATDVIEVRKIIFYGSSAGWNFKYIAVGGETLLSVPHTYIPGVHQLFVFRSGRLQASGAGDDYEETDVKTIKFNTALLANEAVYVIGSSRAFDRISQLEFDLRKAKVRNLLQDRKLELLEQRLLSTPTAMEQGGILEYQPTTGMEIMDHHLVNLTNNALTLTLNLPAAPGTQTQIYVSIAGDYDSATGPVGVWGAIASTVSITVPAGGFIAGWGVLYK